MGVLLFQARGPGKVEQLEELVGPDPQRAGSGGMSSTRTPALGLQDQESFRSSKTQEKTKQFYSPLPEAWYSSSRVLLGSEDSRLWRQGLVIRA